jgi:hypothetical protein
MVNVVPDFDWNSSVPDKVMTKRGPGPGATRPIRPTAFPGRKLDDGHRPAGGIATHPHGKIDPAFLDQRVTILTCPHKDTLDHRGSPFDC